MMSAVEIWRSNIWANERDDDDDDDDDNEDDDDDDDDHNTRIPLALGVGSSGYYSVS